MNKFYTSKYEPVFLYSVVNQEKILKALIEQILERKIDEIVVTSGKINKDKIINKAYNVDVLVKSNNEYINIEININYNNLIVNRNILYACKVLTNGLKKGALLKVIPKATQINLNFDTKGKIGNHVYQLHDKKNNKTLSDILTIYEVDIDIYKKMIYNDNKKFIKGKELIGMLDLDMDKLRELSKESEIVKEYSEKIEEINNDDDFVQLMDYEEEAKAWEEINKELAEEKGLEQGATKKQIEIAKNMLKMGIDIHIIKECTGLEIEEINNLN